MQKNLAPGADWDGTPGCIRSPLGPWTPNRAVRDALMRRGFSHRDALTGAGLFFPDTRKRRVTGSGYYGFTNR